MIDPARLLADLTRQLKRLEADLRQCLAEEPAMKAALQTEWQAARAADRTAATFDTWVEGVLSQAGVHWLLSCVFLRFIEDNGLVERPWLGGPPTSGRLALARDRHDAYFRAHPLESDRDYLLAAFREAGALPGLHTFFDEAHNPVFRLRISVDAALALQQFWQQVDPDSGALRHDFTDADWNTRFLGDLYQDLSEAAKKQYALLQTPEFVEEFILDRTLTPAIREFGYRDVTLIDPTCGSGHFLLGGFHRLVAEWSRHEPARNTRDVAQKALEAVAGVDLNPFAVAISRFRLLVAALQVSGVRRLVEAPDFRMNVAIGDSLLHGRRFGLTVSDDLFDAGSSFADTGLAHAYASEDLDAVQRILGRQYHAVVGNPPYIVVRDAALNQAYRRRYASCHMKYSLGAPFTERFFDLAFTGREGQSAGYVGLITANSFMKREFGSQLIEKVFPSLDLTHVVDTSGAYIPGHGTPTVIMFGRHQFPVGDSVRTVLGVKGEPSTPERAEQGLVWQAILGQLDQPGSSSEFIDVADTPRATFCRHPWSIGGGGAAELREVLEIDRETLSSVVDSVGITCFTLEDEVYVSQAETFRRQGVSDSMMRVFVSGDELRDWLHSISACSFFPYDEKFALMNIPSMRPEHKYMWPFRTCLSNNRMFGKQTKVESGLKWWEYGRLTVHKLRTSLTITFAEVATHNHFVLDRGGKVFKQTAPVIKLPAGSSEDEHLGLLGLLNSSVACFWFQQVCHNKGGPGGGSSKDEKWHDFYAFNSTKVAAFPLVEERPMSLARRLDSLAREVASLQPSILLLGESVVVSDVLNKARDEVASLRRRMIAVQEELDWRCYRLYGLFEDNVDIDDPPEVRPGERAFEIAMARQMESGQLQTKWFDWLHIKPVTEIPCRWPEPYRDLVSRRVALIESDRNIGLVETPACKRRWEFIDWDTSKERALRGWLLDRLESPAYWSSDTNRPASITTASRLADIARRDADFMQIAALYAGHPDFDVSQLVADLVQGEAVPFLPVLRYTDSGLRKRAQWEDTWTLQRREDAGESVGTIPVPPKYQSKDFLKADYWRLRGGLDVPKERWISYPGCERGADPSLPIAWAGWDHLQQATALAAYTLEMKDTEGWSAERLQPLLAGLLELLPWLEQWHNEPDPVHGERMGRYYRGFIQDEARALGVTLDDLRAWRPAATGARRGRRRATS